MAENRPIRDHRTLQSLHWHLVLTGALVTGTFTSVIGLSIFVPIAAQLNRTSLDSPEVFGLAEHFLFVHSAFWPVILLSLIASVVSGTVLFRRMRSPLVRFSRCFETITAGETPDVLRIRTADYLSEEADALNRMITALQRERSDRATCAAQIEEALAELASTPGATTASIELLQEAARTLAKPTPKSNDAPHAK